MKTKFSNNQIIGAGVGLFVVVILIVFYAMHQSVVSAGNQKESDLSGNYADGANFLSNCVIKTKQAANVATAQTSALDKVLQDAVAGRYGKGAQINDKALLGAIVEAYPDTTGLNKTFQDVLATITGCQDDFRNKQSIIQAGVVDFNKWRSGSWTARTFGGGSYPNEKLYVTVGNQHLTGQAALDKIGVPIIESGIEQVYDTGTTDTKNPFDTSGN